MANKKRKCRHCGEYSPVESGIIVPLGYFCSIKHAQEHGQAKANKARQREQAKLDKSYQQEQKRLRSENRKRKEALKTKSQWAKEAQAAVNKFIRIRDHGKPCVSCGSLPAQKFGGSMDAGHYRSVGASSSTRYNVFNIAAQCVKCNRWKSGSAVDYRIELIKRIGLERVERLEADNEPRRYDIEYLKRLKRIFNKRARIYEKLKNLK